MKRSYIWAGVFALVLGGWLASGQMATTAPESKQPQEKVAVSVEDKPFRVVVKTFKPQLRQAAVTLRGRTEPHKTLDVLVRTAGIVERSPFSEGDEVKAGDVLCELDMRDRTSVLARAQAELASAKRDYEAALGLSKKKFVSEAKLASELARLNAASAAVEQAELDIKWTKVLAPVDGTLNSRPAEEGRFLKTAEQCAELVALDPIVAMGQVAERDVSAVRMGQPARIELVTGEELEGSIRFIAPQADVATRTFRVEVEAPNPDHKIRSGITAAIEIPLTATPAHLLPSSLISLDDSGVTGVYAVDKDDKVVFHPVKLLSLGRDGAWVSGLDGEVRLITVGQHYVLPGQTVEPVDEVKAAGGAAS
jgi:multidrug efflux system membrane fusion protein